MDQKYQQISISRCKNVISTCGAWRQVPMFSCSYKRAHSIQTFSQKGLVVLPGVTRDVFQYLLFSTQLFFNDIRSETFDSPKNAKLPLIIWNQTSVTNPENNHRDTKALAEE